MGSEMCIRDSDEGADQGFVHKQQKEGDKIYFIVTAREEESGGLHINTDG